MSLGALVNRNRRAFVCGALATFGLGLSIEFAAAQAGLVQPRKVRTEETWASIKPDLFEDTNILDGSHILSMEAPVRAEDAAVVPIRISVKPGSDVKKVTLVVDENPAPLAAAFVFGPAAGSASFSTRIRVNSYTFVRAVAQTGDGKQYMVKKFVKASGGCSAPASKDLAVAMAQLGKMKLRQFSPKPEAAAAPAMSHMHEAQVMIRHPNNSGFQVDQVTLLHIPPRFVDMIEVKLGDELAMKVEGGISLSEDPNIRFYYIPNGAESFTVNASDTDDVKFSSSWPVTGS